MFDPYDGFSERILTEYRKLACGAKQLISVCHQETSYRWLSMNLGLSAATSEGHYFRVLIGA